MAKTIGDYKKDYAAAAARGDAAGMKAANDGANAIRQSMGQASQVASNDIGKVAGGGTSGMVSNPGRYDDGGYSGGSSRYDGASSGSDSSSGSGYRTYVQGQNAQLDNQLAVWGQRYDDAKRRALGGDMSAVMDMRNANDEANKLRNQYGYAAVFAHDDINNVKGAINYYGGGYGGGGSGGGYPSGSGGGSAAGMGQGQFDLGSYQQAMQDYFSQQMGQQQNYYQQLLDEQQRRYDEIQRQQEAAKQAAVEQAVGQLAGQKTGLEQNYQDLYRQLYLQRRNAEKNLPQQMAAMGYNGGLTESTALGLQTNYADALRQGEQAKQGTLSEIDRAIADARLSGDISIAEQAAKLAQDRLASYGSTVDAMQQQSNWAAQFGYQQFQDAIAQQNWQNQFGYQQYVDDRNFNYQAGRDQVADSQWQQGMSRQQLLDEFNREDTTYERKVQAAQYLYETTGDPSLLAVLGYTPEQIAALKNSYAAAMAGSAGGSGGGGGTGRSGGMMLTTAKQAASAGVFSDDVLSVLRQNGYSDEMLSAIYGYAPSVGSEAATGWSQGFYDLGAQISAMAERTRENLVPTEALKLIESFQKRGRITEDEAKEMGKRWGLTL